MDKIYIVTVQTYDSYDDESGPQTISTHRTEEGANKVADKLKNDYAIHALTGGMTTYYDDPDTVLGLVEDQSSELAEELRQEAAKPGAIFIEAALKVALKYVGSGDLRMSEVKVLPQVLRD